MDRHKPVLIERVKHAARGEARAGAHWGVAVSGGADSVALLHILHELAPEFGIRLVVVHANHGLRGEESAGDAKFVEELARTLGWPSVIEQAPVEGAVENLEQAAREARLAFFTRQGLDRIATGHTQDDQAETVLFRLLRGAGPGGLTGILPVTREGLVRPLLGVRRAEIRAWLTERGIPWREDSSNADSRFARNRIRRDLLPQLESEWNPRLTVLLAQTAQLSREDEEFLAEAAAREAEQGIRRRRDGSLVVEASRLAEMPRALARRVVRSAIRELRGDLRGIEFEALARIEELWESSEGSGRLQIPDVDVMRSFDWLRLARMETGGTGRNWSVTVGGAGRHESPAGELVLEQRDRDEARVDPEPAYNVDTCWLDIDRLGFPMVLRNWRPGDSYVRVGRERSESVKELFQSNRIPLWERRNWPMVTKDDEILWSCRFGPAAAATPVAGSERWQLRFTPRD